MEHLQYQEAHAFNESVERHEPATCISLTHVVFMPALFIYL